MFEKIVKLSNKKYVGCNVFEVLSVPTSKMIADDENSSFKVLKNSFNRLMSELHKICNANETTIEILWLSKETKNQTFKSKIHMYVVLRNIGNECALVEQALSELQETTISSLNKMKFATKCVELVSSEFSHLVKSVDCSGMYSFVKREGVVGNSFSYGGYYAWNILNTESSDDFSGFISELSKHTNCAVSFYVIPTVLSAAEINTLNEVTAIYQRVLSGYVDSNRMVRDESVNLPLKSIQYSLSNSQKPLFYYGICVFGNKNTIKFVSAKLNSLLNSGEEEISQSNPICLDLSKEQISINNNFFMYPWVINNVLINKYREPSYKQVSQNIMLSRMPYLMTSEEINVFFRLPIYKNTMPMLTQNKAAGEAEQFSDDIIGENTIKFGKIISDDGENVEIGCPLKSWTQHALIVGMPGTGKTTFAVNILTQFYKKEIPFLAIEPTKAEYRAMIDAIPDLQIFTPGNNAVSPFIINPFIPPKGITVEQYTPSLVSAFKAAFSMDGPLEMLFLKAINKCYNDYGWKQTSKLGDPDVKIFGIYEYILCFKKVMKSMKYGKETQGNLETAGLLRLMNLIEQNSNIYDNINTVPIEDLLSKPTVLELNAIDNQEQKALIMALLLSSICVHTKNNQKGDGTLKNVILIDEAHVLLDGGSDSEYSGNSKGTTVKTIQNMIAEIRSYGTSIIIADQKPSKVTDDIVANTNVKVAFRLTSPQERNLIKESTDMNDSNAEYLSKLGVGQAFVYFDKLNSPQLVQSEDTRERDNIRLSVSNEEIIERSVYWKDKQKLLIPYRECSCTDCKDCSFKIRADAEFYAEKLLGQTLSKINDKKILIGYAMHITPVLKKRSNRYSEMDFKRLCDCTIVKYIRKAKLNLPYEISPVEIKKIIEISRRK